MTKSPSGSLQTVGKWHVETRLRADGILVSTMAGVGDGAFAVEVEKQLKPFLSRGMPIDWIPDASQITSTEASLIMPAKQVLRTFKDGGGRYVVAVITRSLVAMTASSISLGASLIGASPIHGVVGTMSDALTKIEQLRQRKESA